jgi:putative DNA-invertase from lambdoid prophage Rac
MLGQGEETPMRAGLYAWGSTAEEPTLLLQHNALRASVAERGWTAICQIEDIGSEAAEHPQRGEVMRLARGRALDVVLVWRLDRRGCSLADLVRTLEELNALDVGFVSLSEPLDLTTPSGRAMSQMLVVFAEFERKIRRERVKAGISRAPAGAAAWSSPERGASGGRGSSPGIATDQPVRDRAAAGDRPDVSAEDLGGEGLRMRQRAVVGKPRVWRWDLHLPRSGLVQSGLSESKFEAARVALTTAVSVNRPLPRDRTSGHVPTRQPAPLGSTS